MKDKEPNVSGFSVDKHMEPEKCIYPSLKPSKVSRNNTYQSDIDLHDQKPKSNMKSIVQNQNNILGGIPGEDLMQGATDRLNTSSRMMDQADYQEEQNIQTNQIKYQKKEKNDEEMSVQLTDSD